MSEVELSDLEFVAYFTVDKATLDEGDSLAFIDSGRWPKYLDYLESRFYEEYPA
jgi:hypothetical protein